MTDKSNIHIPVLLNETLECFSYFDNKPGVFLDGTLGGGGHTKAMLERFQNIKAVACDYDIHAIEKAKINLKKFIDAGRLELFHGNFKDYKGNTIDGALLDLGYSSNQLENPEYGMSFYSKTDSPIDMRLPRPPHGETAWEILANSTESELADILFHYGEIKESRSLSKKVKMAIHSGEIENSTLSLAEFLENQSRIPKHKQTIHPATLFFQALRIAVNDELRNLDTFLNEVFVKCNQHARIAVISFHSLEDRIVKQFGVKNQERVEIVTKKPISAQDSEIEMNPRSRSAKLRVFEKK